MEREFVPYELAVKLKALGFDEPCFVYWVFNNVEITFSTTDNRSGWSMIGFTNSQMNKKSGLCTAPTFSQAFRWFREKHGIRSCIIDDHQQPGYTFTTGPGQYYYDTGSINGWFHNYEEAELACLTKLIKIVEAL